MDKNYFKKAEDLSVGDKKVDSSVVTVKDMGAFFKKAGDIISTKTQNDLNFDNASVSEIKDYLLTIISDKKYDAECELGILCGGGNMIVDFQRLQEMVNSGYNIVSAEYINKNMIMVEFQEFKKSENRGMRK